MQEEPQPLEQEAEVIAGGGEDGVDGVACGVAQDRRGVALTQL